MKLSLQIHVFILYLDRYRNKCKSKGIHTYTHTHISCTYWKKPGGSNIPVVMSTPSTQILVSTYYCPLRNS